MCYKRQVLYKESGSLAQLAPCMCMVCKKWSKKAVVVHIHDDT